MIVDCGLFIEFSVEKFPITKIFNLRLAFGCYLPSRTYNFAKISKNVLPYCVLVGLDFMEEFLISHGFKLMM